MWIREGVKRDIQDVFRGGGEWFKAIGGGGGGFLVKNY